MALSSAVAQDNPSNVESVPLVLVRIAMPDVQGRFDHMEIDLKTEQVFAAKLSFAREHVHPFGYVRVLDYGKVKIDQVRPVDIVLAAVAEQILAVDSPAGRFSSH
jgi:hypothetical protein